jgi:hypothetical protein
MIARSVMAALVLLAAATPRRGSGVMIRGALLYLGHSHTSGDHVRARAWRSLQCAANLRSRFRRHTRRTTSTSGASGSPRGG